MWQAAVAAGLHAAFAQLLMPILQDEWYAVVEAEELPVYKKQRNMQDMPLSFISVKNSSRSVLPSPSGTPVPLSNGKVVWWNGLQGDTLGHACRGGLGVWVACWRTKLLCHRQWRPVWTRCVKSFAVHKANRPLLHLQAPSWREPCSWQDASAPCSTTFAGSPRCVYQAMRLPCSGLQAYSLQAPSF